MLPFYRPTYESLVGPAHAGRDSELITFLLASVFLIEIGSITGQVGGEVGRYQQFDMHFLQHSHGVGRDAMRRELV